jgi:hypothetical protein
LDDHVVTKSRTISLWQRGGDSARRTSGACPAGDAAQHEPAKLEPARRTERSRRQRLCPPPFSTLAPSPACCGSLSLERVPLLYRRPGRRPRWDRPKLAASRREKPLMFSNIDLSRLDSIFGHCDIGHSRGCDRTKCRVTSHRQRTIGPLVLAAVKLRLDILGGFGFSATPSRILKGHCCQTVTVMSIGRTLLRCHSHLLDTFEHKHSNRPFPSLRSPSRNPKQPAMADEISYSTVMNVCTCWDRLKRVPNYRDKCGELILQRCVRGRLVFRVTTIGQMTPRTLTSSPSHACL